MAAEKNPTPRTLALAAAAIAAFSVLLLRFILLRWMGWEEGWLADVILFLLTFFAVYLVVIYLIEIFIYRKIKVIYKSIISQRKTKERTIEKVNLDRDILGDVNREVSDWQQDRTDELEELRRMETFRKEFLGNVSHELKTPIFNIQGYIHTLLDGALEDNEINVQYLQRAARSVERLCLIVDDLESISKLESGEMLLEQRTFDLTVLVKDVFESLELQAREKGITLGLKEGSDQPVYVVADKERIRQVLVNLLVNSIKYGKDKGSTLIGFYDMHENVLVEVTDNGIGIEAQHLPRLFERFYRVDKSRSREQGGTGLGLSIVKHILEAHGQTIHVRSTFGIGTTFAFTLKKA
jgi:two-component system phosphate regulon sensor histidine kinase PhoR